MEETNSGIRKKGDWEDVAEFGEDLEEAMEQSDIDDSSVERFREWRPKREEAENDMKRKTVDEAVVEKQSIEEKDDGMQEGIKQASGKVAEAGKKAANGEGAEKDVVDASEDVAIPVVSKLVKFFRKFESIVYSRLSLRDDRYYLDTEDFSVDMKSSDGEYEMDVSMPEKDSRHDINRELGREDE